MRYIRNYDELRNRISHLLQTIYKIALKHCFDVTDKEGMTSRLCQKHLSDIPSKTPTSLRGGTLSCSPTFTTRSEKKSAAEEFFK